MGRRAAQKVVVVNGSHELLQRLESMLDAGHYDIVFAANLEHAYSEIKKNRPDLVILCLDLDDPVGFQVLSMLKLDADTARIPLLTCTTDDQFERPRAGAGRRRPQVGVPRLAARAPAQLMLYSASMNAEDPARRRTERIEIIGEPRGEVMVYQPMVLTEVSRFGAQVETTFPLQIDSLHDFRFALGDRSIVVKGRVVHARVCNVENAVDDLPLGHRVRRTVGAGRRSDRRVHGRGRPPRRREAERPDAALSLSPPT